MDTKHYITKKDDNFKALGIKHSENNDCKEHFNDLRTFLKRTCTLLAKKRASAGAKLMALNSSVIPAAIYKGLYAPWNLKQYQLLDVPISALLRKITKNTAYYPTALLYSPKDKGCHGFTRLSTKIMEQKQQLLHTSLEGNQATAKAMKSILHRALIYNGCPPTYKQSATIHTIHDEGWLSSLVQMHARLDQNIALGGTALANTLDQLILDNHNLGSLFDENERRDIIAAGVTQSVTSLQQTIKVE